MRCTVFYVLHFVHCMCPCVAFNLFLWPCISSKAIVGSRLIWVQCDFFTRLFHRWGCLLPSGGSFRPAEFCVYVCAVTRLCWSLLRSFLVFSSTLKPHHGRAVFSPDHFRIARLHTPKVISEALLPSCRTEQAFHEGSSGQGPYGTPDETQSLSSRSLTPVWGGRYKYPLIYREAKSQETPRKLKMSEVGNIVTTPNLLNVVA